MNFALIGYGKMGHAIESLGTQHGHTFPLIIDEHNQEELNPVNLKEIDAAIEFSIPASAPANVWKCLTLGIPVVSGTTGWNEKLPEIEAYCRVQRGAFFYASNFSIGVNILFALNIRLAEIMEKFPEYKVSLKEVHHLHKKDAPSGTAISLAQQILEVNGEIGDWYLKDPKNSDKNHAGQLPIEAERKDEVRGQHTIRYESPLDTIEISHDAHTRDAFATGVILAAQFIKNKKGVFGMQDLLKL